MRTNKEKCAMQSIQGTVDHPKMRGDGYRVGFDGKGRIIPATGGITYNFFIGDGCMGLAADHLEPGVSTRNMEANENNAYNVLACIGNKATVISGEAKGSVGWVSGVHGGIDHVMLAFDAATLEKLTGDDKFLIKSYGQGLCLLDHPEITVMNLDPELLEKLNIVENADGTISIPVTHVVPAELMGSGLGSSTTMSGDYDIMTHDPESYAQYHLDTLRFGDIVMIENHSNVNGPDYLKGAVTVGVICHSDSFTSGHGPGVTVLFTSRKSLIQPIMSENANLAHYFHFKK